MARRSADAVIQSAVRLCPTSRPRGDIATTGAASVSIAQPIHSTRTAETVVTRIAAVASLLP